MGKLTLLFVCLVLCCLQTFSQTRQVTGRVTDSAGGPVPGATIKIKGIKNGTSADASGAFKISVQPNAVIVISGIGYEAKEINVGNSESVAVSLIGQMPF